MAQTAPGFNEAFKNAVLADFQAAEQRYRDDIARQLIPGGEPVKRTRIQRIRSRVHWGVYDARTKLAQRIAPWLSDEGWR